MSTQDQQRILQRHEDAQAVLRRYDESKAPFVVYLRKFNIEAFHGPPEAAKDLGENMLFDDLPPGVGMIGIADIERSAPRNTCGRFPALWLGADETWQSVLKPILAAAELIVSEFTFLSKGVLWELETCLALGKALKTVLVLPPKNCPFACLDHLKPLGDFPRVFWADQFHWERLSTNFVVADLLKRAGEVAALSAHERRKLYASGDIAQKLPVTSRSLLEGFQARHRERTFHMALGDADRATEYYYFWDWYRSASAAGCIHRFEGAALDDVAFDLVYAYIEILQGLAHRVVELDQSGSFVTTDFVMRLARTVRTLIMQKPEKVGALRGYASVTFDRLGLECDWDEQGPALELDPRQPG